MSWWDDLPCDDSGDDPYDRQPALPDPWEAALAELGLPDTTYIGKELAA